MQPDPAKRRLICRRWTLSELSDSEIIRLVQTGNIDYFAALVDRHQRLVISIVRRAARDAGEIEDLAQEVFLRAYKGLKKFRGESKFSTWLGRIAWRTAIDSLKQRRELEAEGEVLDRLDLDRDVREEPATPEADWENEDERRWVRGLVEMLPGRYRLVVALHYFNDKPVEEVSEITGLPAGTVKSHLHRARLELRRLIERETRKTESGFDVRQTSDLG